MTDVAVKPGHARTLKAGQRIYVTRENGSLVPVGWVQRGGATVADGYQPRVSFVTTVTRVGVSGERVEVETEAGPLTGLESSSQPVALVPDWA